MKTAGNDRFKLRHRGFGALLLLLAASCDADFEDGSMSELKKPELLSIVLEPPEAAPGEQVVASFLLADHKGPIEAAAQLWLPSFELADEGGRRRTNTGSAGLGPDVDLEELVLPELSLVVPERAEYEFDEQGLDEHALGLLVFLGEAPEPDAVAGMQPDDLDALLESGQVKLGIRTLVVSERKDRNRNPRVTRVGWGPDEEEQSGRAELVTSFDQELATVRQQAADQPIEVEEEQKLYFEVEVEDDDPVDEAARYQWISTGGDFGGLRERVQKWEAPDYREPDAEGGERNQRGEQGVEARTDPNLHPVWVIVRDSGISGQLGQSWAEFYVRVIPSADE